jgi:hypothetical protein
VGISGTRIGGRGAVAGQHLAGPPARDPHEVDFGAAGAQPLVGEGMAGHMGVQVGDTGLAGAAVEQIPQPGDGEGPTPADPQGLKVSEPVS